MSSVCVGLENPSGTVSKSGRSATGSLTETDLIAAVTVPDGDFHFLTDLGFAVAKGALGTIFRLYGRTSSSGTWTQIDEIECGDYGTYTRTFGTAHKFKAGEQWKVTGQQTTIARMAVRVGGQARKSDARDF